MSDDLVKIGDTSIDTIGGWLDRAERLLNGEQVESPRFSARLILEHVTGRTRTYLLAHSELTLDPRWLVSANEFLARRLEHEPMAYLLGKKDFRNLTLSVSPGVLIPRPETEGLVDLAIRFKPDKRQARTILDAGTGSGCLALSLVEEYPRSNIIGCDGSSEALAVARKNDPAGSVQWVRSNWIESFGGDSFDLIVSNPPYLTSQEMESLDPQVGDYEPSEALDGGPDGCDAYRLLIPQARKALSSSGVFLLEIGPTVRDEVRRLLEASDFLEIGVFRDLSGRDRYAKGVRGGFVR